MSEQRALLGPGDVAASAEEAAGLEREPLIVLDALESFLDGEGLGTGPLSVRRIGDGHSMETFALTREGFRGILRRPPRPPYAPGAHDVLREARVVRGVLAGSVRAPELLAVCEDETVIGAPFAITEFVDGVVLGFGLPEGFDANRDAEAIAGELVGALAELHGCDPAAVGLGDLGVPGAYLPRQLERFARVWGRDSVREVPEIDTVGRWLRSEMPPAGESRLIHGDFRLGNVLYAPRPPVRLLAILDWETTTVGDPLTDVGYMIGTWPRPEDSAGILISLSVAAADPAFPDRAALAGMYAEATGRDLGDLRWYTAFALWKVAIILEGSYRRYVKGTASDEFFADLGPGVPELALRAQRIIEAGDDWMDYPFDIAEVEGR